MPGLLQPLYGIVRQALTAMASLVYVSDPLVLVNPALSDSNVKLTPSAEELLRTKVSAVPSHAVPTHAVHAVPTHALPSCALGCQALPYCVLGCGVCWHKEARQGQRLSHGYAMPVSNQTGLGMTHPTYSFAFFARVSLRCLMHGHIRYSLHSGRPNSRSVLPYSQGPIAFHQEHGSHFISGYTKGTYE